MLALAAMAYIRVWWIGVNLVPEISALTAAGLEVVIHDDAFR